MSGWDVWNDQGKLLALLAGSASLPTPIGEYSVSTTDTSAKTLATLIAAAVTATTFATGSPATLAAAIIAGATFFTLTVETNDIRMSFMGNSTSVATIGQLYAKGNGFPYAANPIDLTQVVIAAQSAAATLRITLYR